MPKKRMAKKYREHGQCLVKFFPSSSALFLNVAAGIYNIYPYRWITRVNSHVNCLNELAFNVEHHCRDILRIYICIMSHRLGSSAWPLGKQTVATPAKPQN